MSKNKSFRNVPRFYWYVLQYIVLLAVPAFLFSQTSDTVFLYKNFKSEYFGSKCLHFYDQVEITKPTTLINGKHITEKSHRLQTDQYNILKTIVCNKSEFDRKFLVFLHNVQIDVADILLYSKGQLKYNSPRTGCIFDRDSRPNAHRTMAIPVEFKNEECYEMYIRVYRKEFGITVSPHLVNPINGIDFRWTDICFLIVIFSCIFISVLALVLYVYGKSKRIVQTETLIFIIYTLITALYVTAASGYGSLYIWGKYPFFEVNAAIFFGALSGSAFMYLCKVILNIKEKNIWLARWFDFVSIFYIAISLVGFWLLTDKLPKGLFGYILGNSYFLILINMLLILFLVFNRIFVYKEKIYYWFLIIFLFYISYTALVIALEVGIFRYNFEMHAIRIVAAHFPQLIVLLMFLINKMILNLDDKAGGLNNLRKEITQDIHDELGSTLTKISLQAHVASLRFQDNPNHFVMFSTIEENAVRANLKLRHFLVSISPKYDTLEYTIIALKEGFDKIIGKSESQLFHHISHPELIISNVTKNHIIKQFNEILMYFVLKSDVTKIHVHVEEKHRRELHFNFRIHCTKDCLNALKDLTHIVKSNDIFGLGIQSLGQNSIEMKYYIFFKSNRF